MYFNEVSDEAAPSLAHLETKNPVTVIGDGVLFVRSGIQTGHPVH